MITSYVPYFSKLPHLTKLSSRSMFLRSLTNSPIIFLSNRGFSRSHWATSVLSIGMVSRPFSCRNWIPFFGFWLNCSVPVIRSCRRNTRRVRSYSAPKPDKARLDFITVHSLSPNRLLECGNVVLSDPRTKAGSYWTWLSSIFMSY